MNVEQIIERHKNAAARCKESLMQVAEQRLVNREVYANRRVGAAMNDLRDLVAEYHFHMNELDALALMSQPQEKADAA